MPSVVELISTMLKREGVQYMFGIRGGGGTEVRERLLSMGAEPVGITPEQFGAYIQSETAKWVKVIKEAGITAE